MQATNVHTPQRLEGETFSKYKARRKLSKMLGQVAEFRGRGRRGDVRRQLADRIAFLAGSV